MVAKVSTVARICAAPPTIPRVSALRLGLTLVCLALFTGLIADRLRAVDFSAVWGTVCAVAVQDWMVAALATAVSFRAIADYDLAVHRFFAMPVSAAEARRAGFAAIAVSQTLGFGIVTGTILRLRLLPNLSLVEVTRHSVGVMVFFLIGWASVTAGVMALLPAHPAQGVAWLVLAVLAVLATACTLRQPRPTGRRRLPNLATIIRLVWLASVDLGCAGFALWWLMPGDLGFAVFFPAFLLAFGAGLVSGAPGGLGAFEFVLLASLPAGSDADLLAAVVAWRVMYFALPAVLGVVVALISGRRVPPVPPHARSAARVSFRDAPAETGLVRQGMLTILSLGGGGGWLAGRTSHGLVALLQPFGDATRRDCLTVLDTMAQSEARVPMIYKASARLASRARRQGWAVCRIADEAILDPQRFDFAGPGRSGLRRKLRKADQADIVVTLADAASGPLLDPVATAWCQRQGGERGFSMGRYGARTLQDQRVYLARQGGRPIAFVSFHQSDREWTLDLMRSVDALPDGTMHALIRAAIRDAKDAGIDRLSLASVPVPPRAGRVARCLSRHRAGVRAGDGGLRQFKSAFAPAWEPLYAAAPSWPKLILVGAEVARAIHAPPPAPKLNPGASQHAEYEFASTPRAWQRREIPG